MRLGSLFAVTFATLAVSLPAFGPVASARPGVAPQPRVNTVAEHEAEDAVILDAATEKRLQQHTKQVGAPYAAAAAAAVTGSPDQLGQWGPVADWPVVGVHVALLSNGLVLAYDSVGDHATESYPDQSYSRATLYAP